MGQSQIAVTATGLRRLAGSGSRPPLERQAFADMATRLDQGDKLTQEESQQAQVALASVSSRRVCV